MVSKTEDATLRDRRRGAKSSEYLLNRENHEGGGWRWRKRGGWRIEIEERAERERG